MAVPFDMQVVVQYPGKVVEEPDPGHPGLTVHTSPLLHCASEVHALNAAAVGAG
jgi:hypothetical protein